MRAASVAQIPGIGRLDMLQQPDRARTSTAAISTAAIRRERRIVLSLSKGTLVIPRAVPNGNRSRRAGTSRRTRAEKEARLEFRCPHFARGSAPAQGPARSVGRADRSLDRTLRVVNATIGFGRKMNREEVGGAGDGPQASMRTRTDT
jgi:hypothetical protein